MLISRITTALILLPLAIAGILYLPTSYFALVISVIFTLAAFEWTKISLIDSFYKFIFVASNIIIMYLLWLFCLDKANQILAIIFIAVIFWIVSLFFISQFPRYNSFLSKNLLIKFVIGYFLLIPSWYALLLLKDLTLIPLINTQLSGSQLVLIMMLMIWSADTGAYFSGRTWGKSKLLPNVSPGKTTAGVYGAIITTSLVTMIYTYSMISDVFSYLLYALLFATIIVVVSVVGDLFESMFKRNSGIKDSGSILPGHGGILDRIDSLTSVAPVFYTLIYITLDLGLTDSLAG